MEGNVLPWNVRRRFDHRRADADANGNINFRLVGAPSDDAGSHSPLRTPMVCMNGRWLNSQRRCVSRCHEVSRTFIEEEVYAR